MEIQELNYESIPSIEAKNHGQAGTACAQLKRRDICANVGKATFVEEENGANHEEGEYLRMQPDWLKKFLRGPVTHGIYMRGYVAVFAAYNRVEECVAIVANVESIFPTIAADNEWIARKLS